MMAKLRSTQLRLLLWKFRQSVTNLRTISKHKTVVTTVSARSGEVVQLGRDCDHEMRYERTNKGFMTVIHICTPKALAGEAENYYYNPEPVCLAISSFQSASLFRRVIIFRDKAPTECQLY